MATAYQYTDQGYYAGPIEDYGLLPNNATYTAPQEKEGFIPRWNGKAWEWTENHKGRDGYVNGQPFTVTDFGPLPEGWSDAPPEPTLEEETLARMAEIDAEIHQWEQKALRPLLAIQSGTDDPYDHERQTEILNTIIDLRCERQNLEMLLLQAL